MPRSERPARPSKPTTPRPKPPAGDARRKESLQAFTESAKRSLRALTQGREEERAAREAERDEVARSLKLALKAAPELKSQLDRVTKALKDARDREDEAATRAETLAKAGLAELDALTKRHLA
jgi:hypothetical protein